jgi:hypothetical protein
MVTAASVRRESERETEKEREREREKEREGEREWEKERERKRKVQRVCVKERNQRCCELPKRTLFSPSTETLKEKITDWKGA